MIPAKEGKTSPGIQIENVTISYGEKPVLNRFSLALEGGKTTILMAPSGWGKTTLLRLIAGLEHAQEGSVSFTGGTAPSIRMVFQENRLLEHLDAVSNVSLANPDGDPSCFSTVLTKSGLLPEDYEGKPVETFSGGMQRRVSLIRALVSYADILLLDEPFTGLDAGCKEEVMALAGKLWEGKTVVIATHDSREALALGDRIWNAENVAAQTETDIRQSTIPANQTG